MKSKPEKAKALIKRCGEMWARNASNIGEVPRRLQGGQGVYILYDGSMPVYIGKGNIQSRLQRHLAGKRLKQMWDHFSWYVLNSSAHMHEIETLLLRMLPPYLRSLTRQRGKFNCARPEPDQHPQADMITRKPAPRRSTRRKRR